MRTRQAQHNLQQRTLQWQLKSTYVTHAVCVNDDYQYAPSKQRRSRVGEGGWVSGCFCSMKRSLTPFPGLFLPPSLPPSGKTLPTGWNFLFHASMPPSIQ